MLLKPSTGERTCRVTEPTYPTKSQAIPNKILAMKSAELINWFMYLDARFGWQTGITLEQTKSTSNGTRCQGMRFYTANRILFQESTGVVLGHERVFPHRGGSERHSVRSSVPQAVTPTRSPLSKANTVFSCPERLILAPTVRAREIYEVNVLHQFCSFPRSMK